MKYKRVARRYPGKKKGSGDSSQGIKTSGDDSNPSIEAKEDLSKALIPYVPPAPLSIAYPEISKIERKDPLAWPTQRFPELFRKEKWPRNSSTAGKTSTPDPYGWMNDAFPCIFKRKNNSGSQKEVSSTKGKKDYDWKRDLFRDYSEVEKAVKFAEQYNVEETTGVVTIEVVAKEVQEKEPITEDTACDATTQPEVETEEVQESKTDNMSCKIKGKEAIAEESEEKSSESSSSHRSEFDEDPEETVQKILIDLKNSGKKPSVEDDDYVPSPIATSDSSHSSEDVPLKNKIEELRKKKKTEGSGLKRKEGPILRNCKEKCKIISKRGVIAERIIDEAAFDQYRLTDFLNDKGLMKSVTYGKHYNPTLVQEFYSNLSPEIKFPRASGYHKIFLRGKTVKFSPEDINDFLECPTEVENGAYVYNDDFEYSDEIMDALTGGKCSTWDQKQGSLPQS
ncbi:uncharacterized protein LOC120254443 [Dioscorea cayenensis subsp. rotundata]|uniref:Uncharacterized protein LOC120254443 n=1 Tax=Dioscorea cayennensis subsp. rotundata TaxID=55577 RepID=A0AB40AU89_DIOCR|nr:uncharacterized protein LOC120254443 [Dioscorea cayenensis subsp. rotundata]